MFDIEASHAISYIHTCFDKVKSRNYIISLIYEKERERERERERTKREREREHIYNLKFSKKLVDHFLNF
jgi:hypothetical protein